MSKNRWQGSSQGKPLSKAEVTAKPKAKPHTERQSGYQEIRDKVVELVSQDPQKAATILTDWIKIPTAKKNTTPRTLAPKPKKAA